MLERAIGWIKAAASTVGSYIYQKGQALSLVPNWLANLRWLIDAAFYRLAREGYGRNSIAYSCLRLLSQSVPEPPLVVYRKVNATDREPVPYEHPLAQLTRSPNELMTEYEMWELITLHLGIIGRSTWWKERDNAGRVVAVWPLRPDRVGPVYSEGDSPTGMRVIKGWSYQIPGTAIYIQLPREDVFLVNFADPTGESGGMIEGLGPLQVLAPEVSADNAATVLVGALTNNYAQPGIVLKYKAGVLSAEEALRIKAGFKRDFSGAKAGEPAVIDADVDVTPIGFNLRDLEFPSLRDVAEARICAAFGVPAILVGLNVGLKSGIRATIKEQRAYFAETTLSNYWKRLQEAWTRDLGAEFGDDLVCEFDLTKVRALAEHLVDELQPIAEGYKAGAVMVDEYRAALHLPPLPNGAGQAFVLPANVQVVAAFAGGASSLPPPPPPPRLPPGKAVRALSESRSDRGHAVIDQIARRHERAVRDAMVEAFGNLAEPAIERLRGRKAISASTLVPSDWEDELRALLRPLIEAVLRESGERASDEFGLDISFDLANPEARRWLGERLRLFSASVYGTTIDDIAAQLREAETNGESIERMAARIRAYLDASKITRAELIARTETIYAANQGAIQAYRQADVAQWQWWATADERTCPICSRLHGSLHPIGEDFEPGHPDCRCACIPVVEGA